MQMQTPPLILASTSPYRRELLRKLGIQFNSVAPPFDEETAKTLGLAPQALAEFLAKAKALSLDTNQSIIIGGDQLVALDSQVLGKPKSIERAVEQLQMMSGRSHTLVTAVCVAHKNKIVVWSNKTELQMRNLSESQIRNYIKADKPLDCAGSYKIEKNGLGLFEKIETTDWSAIQGLPLIELGNVLSDFGLLVPGEHYE